MTVPYSVVEINARLQGVADTIDANGSGYLVLRAASVAVSTIQLSTPCGTVAGGILTFGGQLLDPAAASTGNADSAVIQDANNTTIVSGLTVGSSSQLNTDIIISNGLNSTLISSGQAVSLTSAVIRGA